MSHETRLGIDPFMDVRNELQQMRDGSKLMTGDALFGVLEKMYQARARKLGSHTPASYIPGKKRQIPGDFTFPGSRGEVVITHIEGDDEKIEVYNVLVVASNMEEREFATIKFSLPGYKAGISLIDTEDGRPDLYVGSIGKMFGELFSVDPSEATRDLSSELLTALNFLHKPSRGQRTRPRWSGIVQGPDLPQKS